MINFMLEDYSSEASHRVSDHRNGLASCWERTCSTLLLINWPIAVHLYTII